MSPRHIPARHLALLYQDGTVWADQVAEFLLEGAKQGEGLLVVVRSERWDGLADRFLRAGIDPEDLEVEGRLVVLDAEEALQRFETTREAPQRFPQVAGGLLDRLGPRRGRAVRAYGELADLHAAAHDAEALVRLETEWNQLLRHRPATLLCGYDAHALTGPTHDLHDEVEAVHAAVLTGGDPVRLPQA